MVKSALIWYNNGCQRQETKWFLQRRGCGISLEKNKNHMIVYTLKKEPTNGEKPLADSSFGGGCGIRTHVGLHPNWFRISPVMTASITLRICILKHSSKDDLIIHGFWILSMQSCDSFCRKRNKTQQDITDLSNNGIRKITELPYFI